MNCSKCTSRALAEFSAETMVHCSGIENKDFPGLLLFPELLVCLECGSTQFVIPESELRQLIGCSRKKADLKLEYTD